ncbi:MAG: type IV secretory system conjugative DNA transfer family protein [Rhodospirillaceae bacterium]
MAARIDHTTHPFGTAHFSGLEEVARAGMFTRSRDSLLVGFLGGRPLFYSGMGGGVCVAGARSGKLRDLIGYNICDGMYAGTLLILDIKGGELAAISRCQSVGPKACIYWNPLGLHDLPKNRINPVDFVRANSPTLVSDTKLLCENLITASGSGNAAYFEGRAREFLEAVILTLVRVEGVLTLPALYRIVNLMVAGGEAWLDFAFEMTESGFAIAERVEEEIANAREDSSGGFKGILGEVTRAFSALSDPILMESVSPPYDFSFADLCQSDQAYNVYLLPPADFVTAWAPVVKSMFVAAQIYKARAPAAPRQTWLLDECGQLGKFPLVVSAFTKDAGTGIRPWAFFQSIKQISDLGQNAQDKILSSAALQNWFGVRDETTAALLSRMLGQRTIHYTDERRREAARHAHARAAVSMFHGGDPFRAGLELTHQARLAHLPELKQLPLASVDELLAMPGDRQVIFADGLGRPLWAEKQPYYEQPFMARRAHPNPFHGPNSHVQVMTPRGPAWRPVITAPVPAHLAHLPQYANGTWSTIG